MTSTRTCVRWCWAVCLKAGREISFQQQQACTETTALPILCIINAHFFLHVPALQDLLGTILKKLFLSSVRQFKTSVYSAQHCRRFEVFT